MCGRFTLSRSPHEVAEHFALPEAPELAPRYNIAPTQPVAVVELAPHTRDVPDARALRWRRWGLIPAWAKDPAIASRLVNARAESAADKPAFRDALVAGRCLVPADGFYEWRAVGGPARRGKEPNHVALAGGGVFAIAGLAASWTAPGGDVVETCTLLTMDANDALSDLHARMPLILDPEDHAAWLDPRVDGAALLARLLSGPLRAAGALRFRPVGKRVNDVRNDDAACLEADVLPLFAGLADEGREPG